MSERRPHWDDDLTDAVFRALSHTYRAQGWTGGIAIDLDESVYPLIAAVEDWHLSRMGQSGDEAVKPKRQRVKARNVRVLKPRISETLDSDVCRSGKEAERLTAAIKRVQGICEVIVENAHQFYEVWDEDPTAAQVPYGQWMVARHILRALDGERDG